MLSTLEYPSTSKTDDDDDYVHLICCNPNLSLCGKDVTEEPMAGEFSEEETCIFCLTVDEMNLPCQTDGRNCL